MSMFHELMMRKKEEIMYATIKGSLTESPEGVFSGFSASNYLQVNNALPTTIGNKYVFEGETEITATTSAGSYIFSFFCNRISSTSIFGLLYRSSGYFAVAETNGAQETVHPGTIAYQINTKYKYKVETDLNTYIRVYINDVLDISISLSYNNIRAYDGTIYYGIYAYGGNNSLPLTNGSINLNNTSVKINSTKYNLQAVVGYTVVGSPTITDGVVSGFSSANYLQCLPNLPNYTKLERFVKFNTGTTTTNTRTIIGSSPYGSINLEANTNKIRTTIFVSPTYATMTLNTALLENTTYYYRDILENGTVKGYLYDSNMNLIEEKSSALGYDTGRYFIIGKTTNSERPFTNGSVYLNETYVKVDNKLWFNGQQA